MGWSWAFSPPLLLAVELVGRFEVEGFEGAEDDGAGGGAEATLQLRAKDDATLSAAEDGL